MLDSIILQIDKEDERSWAAGKNELFFAPFFKTLITVSVRVHFPCKIVLKSFALLRVISLY